MGTKWMSEFNPANSSIELSSTEKKKGTMDGRGLTPW